jgi:hypothetical protein
MVSLSGCGNAGAGSSSEAHTGTQETSAGQERVIMQRNSQDIEMYDIQGYQERLFANRESILQCIENYGQDVASVKDAEYSNFDFSSCSFSDIPEFEKLYVLMETDHGITTEESWNYIEQWLESIGKSDLMDMEKEVRIVSPELEWEDSEDYPYNYPALSEHMDLSSGEGAFVDTIDCHIQMSVDGVYSMSDGKMNSYLHDSSLAHLGALAEYSGNVVAEGEVSELSDESYPLVSGNLTIGEGAKLVKKYFETETPFPPADGVTINVPKVSVFTFGDVYGYDYWVQRVYKGVPIVCGGYKTYVSGSVGMPDEDTKDAYVIDDEGSTAYAGKDASAVLTELYSDDMMIGFEQSVQMLSEKMASRVEVVEAGLVYAPVSFDEGISETIFPCWMVNGINLIKDEEIVIYIDVFTGEIYYYTMIE